MNPPSLRNFYSYRKNKKRRDIIFPLQLVLSGIHFGISPIVTSSSRLKAFGSRHRSPSRLTSITKPSSPSASVSSLAVEQLPHYLASLVPDHRPLGGLYRIFFFIWNRLVPKNTTDIQPLRLYCSGTSKFPIFFIFERGQVNSGSLILGTQSPSSHNLGSLLIGQFRLGFTPIVENEPVGKLR